MMSVTRREGTMTMVTRGETVEAGHVCGLHGDGEAVIAVHST